MAHPLKSNDGCTFSTIRRYFFHDAPYLTYSDIKIFDAIMAFAVKSKHLPYIP